MPQSTISIRVDSTLKEKFDSLCEAFGLTTTAAFNVFMKTVIRERRIPFEIRADIEQDQRKKALAAFHSMRLTASENGLTDMPLEEINNEIKAARDERKNGNLRSH